MSIPLGHFVLQLLVIIEIWMISIITFEQKQMEEELQ